MRFRDHLLGTIFSVSFDIESVLLLLLLLCDFGSS